jgi:16S rRNA pseudouridine516 synthase
MAEVKTRLDKLLAHRGYGSRKQVKQLIRDGWVMVNGELVVDDDVRLDPSQDEVIIFNEVLNTSMRLGFLHHKQSGVICSHVSDRYPTIYERLNRPLLPNTHTVGRLDVDTQGIILITNDGQLTHRLLSPRQHVEKVYEVHLQRPFDVRYTQDIERGLRLNETETCRPARIEHVSPTRLKLTLVEGKYHQVKRMMHACDNDVIGLTRTHFAGLSIEGLAPGETRPLSEAEWKHLKNDSSQT